MTKSQTFDPTKYLTKLGKSDYLAVKWRLVWLRELYPDAIIETELVKHDGKHAVFKASIEIPSGGGMATGHGSEGFDDFRDYIEKAETKAIGRALAALGFGTQFAEDFSTLVGQEEVGQPAQGVAPTQDAQSTPNEVDRQRAVEFLGSAAREVGMTAAAAEVVVLGKYPDIVGISDVDHHKLRLVGEAIRTWVAGKDAAHVNTAWANHIAEAENIDQLEEIGKAMGLAEVKNGLLRGAWRRRKDQLTPVSVSAATAAY